MKTGNANLRPERSETTGGSDVNPDGNSGTALCEYRRWGLTGNFASVSRPPGKADWKHSRPECFFSNGDAITLFFGTPLKSVMSDTSTRRMERRKRNPETFRDEDFERHPTQ